MNEILEIEIDGETEKHHGSERAGRAPAWGLPVAVALAGALVLAVLMTVVVPGLTDGRNTPAPMDPASGRAPEAQAPPQDEDLVSLDPIDAADAALDAWARFAVTGDLTLLDGTFDPNGPQYELLETEAGNRSTSTPDAIPYEIEFSNVSVDESKDLETVVGATLRWTRSGETEQSFGWDLVLRLGSGDRWLLWTVRDRAPGAVP